MAGLISAILKSKNKSKYMTVQQLIEKQKYKSKVIISFYSPVAGCRIDDPYYAAQTEALLFDHGHRIVDWFYIQTDGTGSMLVIEVV